jgi:hypothetical protein
MIEHNNNVVPIETAPHYHQTLQMRIMRLRQGYEGLPERTRGGLRVLGIAAVAILATKLGANYIGGPQGNNDPARYGDNQLDHVSSLVLSGTGETPKATVRYDPDVDDDIVSNRVAILDVTKPLEVPTTHVYRVGTETADNTAIWYGVPVSDLENALPASERDALDAKIKQDADNILWINAQRANPNFDR